MSKINIQIDFQNKPKFFQDPEKIISCHKLKDVAGALADVSTQQKKGNWAAGFIAYEAGYAFEEFSNINKKYTFPLVWFAVFKKYSEFSTVKNKKKAAIAFYKAQKNIAERDYVKKIKKIKKVIARGDTYQVNYTFKYSFQFKGKPQVLYEKLKEVQATKYSAFIQTKDFSILSLSPELFYKEANRNIIVRPMKGTIARGKDEKDDKRQAESLAQDKKNQAENLMIVDLLRNDLGRICRPGSVQTKKLYTIEKYPTLLQMTSEIKGILKKNIDFADIIKNIFPAGSITGAPKIETMRIIRGLEDQDRKIYTGIIGYLSPKETIFNVAIRTLLLSKAKQGKYLGEMGIGGGITYSSDPNQEYEEALLKARFLSDIERPFQLIETMLSEKGKIFLKQLHLKRLENSAKYYGFSFPKKKIVQAIKNTEHCLAIIHRCKIRLLLSRDGEFTISHERTNMLTNDEQACISKQKVNSQDQFLYHKTTRRKLYESEYARAKQQGKSDILFFNERGELAEGAISNVVVQLNGKKYTPPISSGLLPGTYREYLLKKGEVREKVLSLKDLKQADQIYLCNSVKKLWPVKLVPRFRNRDLANRD